MNKYLLIALGVIILIQSGVHLAKDDFIGYFILFMGGWLILLRTFQHYEK